jgi:hypothetical protein
MYRNSGLVMSELEAQGQGLWRKLFFPLDTRIYTMIIVDCVVMKQSRKEIRTSVIPLIYKKVLNLKQTVTSS